MIWFDVRDLQRDGYPLLILVGEAQHVGLRKMIVRRDRSWPIWAIRTVKRGTTWRTEDLGKRASAAVTRWRPMDPLRFPDPLPQPASMVGEISWQSPAPVAPPLEFVDTLEWQYQYSEPPDISRREVEVRTLRGLRTMRSRYAVKDDHRVTTRDSVLVNLMRQLGEYVYDYVDPNELAPAGTAWEPTRADHGDWLTSVGWFNKLDRNMREIINLRSLNPPYSFQAIGERQLRPRSHTWARRKYQAALDELIKIANKGAV